MGIKEREQLNKQGAVFLGEMTLGYQLIIKATSSIRFREPNPLFPGNLVSQRIGGACCL